MNTMLKTGMFAIATMTMAFAVNVNAQTQGNPATGAELYSACAPCHGLTPKMAGQPVEKLVQKMKTYQTGTYEGKKLGMQKALQPLSDQQLLDIAAYINGI